MSLSPLPTPLQQLGSRRFSFHPPILNIAHNEWIYRRSTWSEIVVVNGATGEEACIPRMFLGDLSFGEHPLVILALKRDLEWKDGRVRPHRCQVIEFPAGLTRETEALPHPGRPAPVINIRLEQTQEKRTGRKIAVAVMLGSVGCLVAADFVRHSQLHRHPASPHVHPPCLSCAPFPDSDNLNSYAFSQGVCVGVGRAGGSAGAGCGGPQPRRTDQQRLAGSRRGL